MRLVHGAVALILAAGTSAKQCEEASVLRDDGKFALGDCSVLDLKGSSIGPNGARELSEALKSNHALTTLNLYGNGIGDDGSKALAEALKINGALTTLNLYGNAIGVAGAKTLASALVANQVLTTLGLGSNKIGAEGAQALAETLKINSALTTLGLGSNAIGDDGAKALAMALKQNSVLKALDAGYNAIGDRGGLALSEAIRTNGVLTDLYIPGNDFGDGVTEKLNGVLAMSLGQRREAKQEHKDLLQWAAAHGLGDSELAILASWGVFTTQAVRDIRGTPMHVLFPRHSNYIVAAMHDFFGLGPSGRVSAEMKSRIFAALNAPNEGSIFGQKEEL